jgi:hypothetical protein
MGREFGLAGWRSRRALILVRLMAANLTLGTGSCIGLGRHQSCLSLGARLRSQFFRRQRDGSR